MTERCSGRYGTNLRCALHKGHNGDCGPWAPKVWKRTQLATELQAQAAMFERFGVHGLNVEKLTTLLRDAAKTLDSKVKPLELPKAASVPPKPVGPTNRTLREGEVPKRGDR